jgi:hypothetical protein
MKLDPIAGTTFAGRMSIGFNDNQGTGKFIEHSKAINKRIISNP